MRICVFLEQVGLGKSFYTKLLILRCRLLGIDQYVVDPDREYTKIAQSVNGTVLKIGPSSNTFINVLDIRQESADDEQGYLATKISRLLGFFKLIFGNLNEEEKATLEEKIIEMYEKKGITFDDKSLYKNYDKKINIKPIFKESEDMPILEDLFELLNKIKKQK